MSKYENESMDMAYRIYMSDAVYYEGKGQRLEQRLYDLIYPEPIEDINADEIAFEIINKLKER